VTERLLRDAARESLNIADDHLLHYASLLLFITDRKQVFSEKKRQIS
jgi:hypothetical protein